MIREHTKLVTGAARVLASSGIWDFWDAQDARARRLRQLSKGELDVFAPLTITHDAVKFVFYLVQVLFAVGLVCFLAEIGLGLLRNPMTVRVLRRVLRRMLFREPLAEPNSLQIVVRTGQEK